MNALDRFAFFIFDRPEEMLWLFGLGVLLTGALLSWVLPSEQRRAAAGAEIRRAPYFALIGLTKLLWSVVGLSWMVAAEAAQAGMFWLIAVLQVAMLLGVGLVYGLLSQARSRSGWGHARRAWLAFVPLASFWLMLKPAREAISGREMNMPWFLAGGTGVAIGFVAFAAGRALSSWLDRWLDAV